MGEIWRDAARYTVLGTTFMLPIEKRVKIDRWLRGREEYRKLQRADWVLLSWGKSGRTWLRVMLSRFYQLKFDLPPRSLLEFDNLNRQNPQAPSVFFTHNNYLRNYTKHWDSHIDFYDKRVIMLVRDPRDVAVSQFFQWKYRMRPWKKRINKYPLHREDVSIYEFMMNPAVGLPRIIDFFNGWAEELPNIPRLHIVRYEDIRSDPVSLLGDILRYTGTPSSDEEVREAVAFASYDNMKKLEKERYFRRSGARLMAADSKNPDSFKVRRAKVGGYRDYFDNHQVTEIDHMLEARLNPIFGYTAALAQGVTRRIG